MTRTYLKARPMAGNSVPLACPCQGMGHHINYRGVHGNFILVYIPCGPLGGRPLPFSLWTRGPIFRFKGKRVRCRIRLVRSVSSRADEVSVCIRLTVQMWPHYHPLCANCLRQHCTGSKASCSPASSRCLFHFAAHLVANGRCAPETTQL